MCTLSWIRRSGGYELAFNRDERLERVAAEPPRVWGERGATFIAPRDPEGGGTWIATNEAGVTCCLLNNYEAAASLSKPERVISRGQLVVRLAGCDDARQVRCVLGEVELRRFSPFIVVVFELERLPCAFVWDGRELQERLALRAPISTSGVRHEQVLSKRRRAFEALQLKLGRPLRTHDLLEFHRTRTRRAGATSVAMRRPGFGSVSLTHVKVSRETAVMRYWAGDPAKTRDDSPAEVTLAVTTAGSDDVGAGRAPTTSIDVRAAFEAKNPKLARRIPGFGFGILKRVVRQTQINHVIQSLRDVAPLDYPEAVLAHLGVELRCDFENDFASDSGTTTPPIYVANHPLGGLDGLALLAWLLRRHERVVAPVNDVLMTLGQLAPHFVPLDRERAGRALSSSIDRVFEAGAPVLLFPAGRTSRMVGGRLRDAKWGRMVAERALRERRTVVPIFVSGRNSRQFYAVAALRRALGVSTNVEMFMLPREVLAPSIEHVQLTIGREIGPAELQRMGNNAIQRAAALRARCYLLDRDAPLQLEVSR